MPKGRRKAKDVQESEKEMVTEDTGPKEGKEVETQVVVMPKRGRGRAKGASVQPQPDPVSDPGRLEGTRTSPRSPRKQLDPKKVSKGRGGKKVPVSKIFWIENFTKKYQRKLICNKCFFHFLLLTSKNNG